MKKVKLWSVKNTDGKMKAEYVPDVDNTDTEQILEDLLVESPELLMDELSLIGRQIPTEGGPLDLLGVDEDGGLVVFELKRGTLTRDAVAQILDYASDLVAMEQDRFAKLVEESSGKYGIDPIEDFADWYSQNFPNRDSVFETPPRMVLVGLGVDRRALRIVELPCEYRPQHSPVDLQCVQTRRHLVFRPASGVSRSGKYATSTLAEQGKQSPSTSGKCREARRCVFVGRNCRSR